MEVVILRGKNVGLREENMEMEILVMKIRKRGNSLGELSEESVSVEVFFVLFCFARGKCGEGARNFNVEILEKI